MLAVLAGTEKIMGEGKAFKWSRVGRQLLRLSNWSTLGTVQLWRLKSHCVIWAQNSAVSLEAIVTMRCYWFGEILEVKHCEGWWVGHPAQSQPLVVLESKDITLFNVLNVLLSKCYLRLHNSLKLSGHSSSRIEWNEMKTGTHFKKLSLLTFLHVLLSPWRARLRLDFKPSITQAHAEAKRWGRAPICPAETSGAPEQDGHMQAPCWEVLQASPHTGIFG